jgi:hypothetical protein
MLSNDQYAVAQREALIWIGRDRGFERGVRDCYTGRGGDDPPDMLI